MTGSFALHQLATAVLTPPGLPLLVVAVGAVGWRRSRLARTWVVFGVLLGWALSTVALPTYIDRWRGLPQPIPVSSLPEHPRAGAGPQAIVVLGGGRVRGALESPETGTLRLKDDSVARVLYAAHVAQRTRLPVLVSGGAPDAPGLSEAALMAALFAQLHVPVRWVEGASQTTAENAALATPLLKQAGVTRIYLVTHYWHSARAAALFRAQGLVVTPLPCGYAQPQTLLWTDFLPSAEGLIRSRLLLREALGRALLSTVPAR